MKARQTLIDAALALFGKVSLTRAGPREDQQAALDLLGRGTAAFRAGDIATATRHWTEAIRLCQLAGARQLEAEALARRGEAYRVEGRFREAEKDMTAALNQAWAVGDGFLIAAASGALGNLYLMLHRMGLAERRLRESQAGARRLGDATLAGASANDLGNVYAATGRVEQADHLYAEAVRWAEAAGDRTLAATAEANAARLALDRNDPDRATDLLRRATDRLVRMEPSYSVGLTLVAVGMAALASAGDGPLPARLFSTSQQAFEAAVVIADRLGNSVLDSLAHGGLGRLHERSRRLDQASRLTQHALFRAQQASAPDISFRWDWQQARIERALGHDDAALAGFRRAVSALQSVRQDIPIEYRDGRSSFRGTYGPLYIQFVDLLLRRASRDRRNAAPRLREARETLERLKETELQDYFHDSCIADFEARQRGVETVAPDTAVIYPVILPDRLELLVSVGNEDPQQLPIVPIAEPRLRTEVKNFRRLLERRATNEFLDPARWLHDLLIRPVNAVLAGRGIGTLVVVPDGVLRTIPFAALHDGEHFLIERYAVATVPGLRLVDPRPLTPEVRRTLAAGLSQGRYGFPALPNVVSELEGIRQLQRSTTLLDDTFLRSRFERELQDVNYTVVHIASHSQVDSDPSRTFVLAYDGQLTLEELEDNIKQTRFRELGVELLVLNACRTAAGDDRAALGLAGLALKAGARSVLATLWFISDETSKQLTLEFYRQLQNRALSKARALQAAQRSMLGDPVRRHPAYWSPFLLIGNWL
ncbi:MAG: CHAT domain-containing protein [Rhodopila sp.]